MAYVFDPINNTLIDDEDKSLGNKLQLMDGGMIGGGVIAGKNFGDRTGFAAPRRVLADVNDDALLAEWRSSLNKKNAVPWKQFLREKFDEKTSNTLRSRIRKNNIARGIPFNPEEEFEKVKSVKKQNRINIVKKMVAEHNASDKFLYDKQEVYKKLGVSRLTSGQLAADEIFRLVDSMDSMDDKIKNAFDKITDENLKIYKPKKLTDYKGQYGLIKQMIADIVTDPKKSRKYQAGFKKINNTLNTHQPYLDMKVDFDYLDKYQSKNFVGKSFNEALEYSKNVRGGLDIKNLESKLYTTPESNIYAFASRHAFLNNRRGTPSQVEFFKINNKGKPIGKALNFDDLPRDANKTTRLLDSNKYGFTYKNKFFTKKTLKTEGFNSGLFDEVYNLSQKGRTLVPDPNNPNGPKITLRELLNNSGDKLTIGHNDAKGGVQKLPFNNLRIESGQLNSALYSAYGRVKNKQLRKLIVDELATQFPSINLEGEAYEKAFINEQSKILKNLNKKSDPLSLYRSAGQKVIKKLGPDFLKKSKPFQKEALRVAGRDVGILKDFAKSQGIPLNSFVGVVDLTQANIELPAAVKKAADNVLNVGGKILRAGGKAAVVLDPMFAAMDASEAFSKGASGEQAVNYVAGRLVEGLVNLPALAKGGFDFAVDKARGKDAKFEMPYEATFAQDYLKNVLEQTPEEVLEARKAQLEFDQTVRPGMTMVDDIDIPASKAEIEAAENKFMDEKGIDLSVLDEPKPDKTFSQFLANGGRVGFNNGGAAGADENFATELEYFLTNEDAELPQLSTYSEPNNPIQIINDIIDPRNYPYYADVLARSGVRIGEFATRILPATGKLINDLITKPAFKIETPSEGVSKKSDYVQEYTDILPSNIKGTGIFSEFLKNITPTATEKFIGLDKLIETEEQKQKDRGSTVGPKVFAETIGLGAEVTAPIFPGLKLLRAYAANRNLPVNDVTKKILVKEIDEVLETQGMNRREFLQATGAGATVILAKMLGFGDEVAQTAKVVEKAAAAPAGVPPYFFDLVEIIKKKGIDTTKRRAIKDLENVYSYKGYDLYEDLATGEIRIEKTNTGVIRSADDVEEGIASQDVMEYKPGRGDESTKGTPPDEYEQGSLFPDVDGKMKEVEDLDVEKLLEFIKNEKVN